MLPRLPREFAAATGLLGGLHAKEDMPARSREPESLADVARLHAENPCVCLLEARDNPVDFQFQE